MGNSSRFKGSKLHPCECGNDFSKNPIIYKKKSFFQQIYHDLSILKELFVILTIIIIFYFFGVF